jgi:hypothetical protein
MKTQKGGVAMKQKDIKTATEGGEAMRKGIHNKLLELGFVHLETEEAFEQFGKLFWDVYYFEYEAEIEPVWERKWMESFYTEGLELALEIPVSGYYTRIYRAVWYKVYLIHIATGPHDRYFRIWIYDKEEAEKIAQIEVSEGYIFCGSQSDLGSVLPKLIKLLNPQEIRIF